MRFEPRIVRASEPAFDSEVENWSDEQFEAALPGDLEALAAQLRDDASHLAATYPAPSAPLEPIVSLVSPGPLVASERKQVSRATALLVSAGLLASVAMVAVTLPWMFPSDSGTVLKATALKATAENSNNLSNNETSVRDVTPTHIVPTHIIPTHLVDAPAGPSDSRESLRGAITPTPALFLQNVSGPELEGLFDLWEADAVEQSRISI